MKIIAIVDKIGSAIWKCATAENNLKQYVDYEILAVHPKKPSVEQLEEFRIKSFEADLIDFQYWKSAMTALKLFPEIIERKIPTVLTVLAMTLYPKVHLRP